MLGAGFANVSKTTNYPSSFQDFKRTREEETLDLSEIFNERYNAPFTFRELEAAITAGKDSAPGQDELSSLMLKNLSGRSKEYLLRAVNRMWERDT